MTQKLQKEKALNAAAASILQQAEEANGEYGIPVSPEVADFMGISASEDISGYEED